MLFTLSAVGARIVRNLGVLDPRLVAQIDRVPSKAERCTLRAPIGELQKARDALAALVGSDEFWAPGAPFHRETYRSVLAEVTFLADPATSISPTSDDRW